MAWLVNLPMEPGMCLEVSGKPLSSWNVLLYMCRDIVHVHKAKNVRSMAQDSVLEYGGQAISPEDGL